MAFKISNAYLICYNIAQLIGWLLILVKTVQFLLTNDPHIELWNEIKTFVQIFQTLAVLEVFHCLCGIVPSNWLITSVQVGSRLMIVWGIIFITPQIEKSIGINCISIAWSVTEVVRSLYYLAKLTTDKCPFWITWCRYTFFYILYPLGVSGEILTILDALPIIKKAKILSISLPNMLNCPFNYYYVLLAMTVLYVPGFPQLYCHMMSQRCKVLSKFKVKQK